MQELSASPEVAGMFTRDSHHEDLTIIVVTQNYFGPGARIIINRNATYTVTFK
jgi:hypothetical protein